MGIKLRLLQLDKKQVDLLAELEKRGCGGMTSSLLSAAINKRINTPKAFKIRELCEKILDEWESEEI